MAVEIKQHIADVNQRMQRAAERAKRDPKEIRLIAVSKTHPLELINQALAAGVVDLGENRVQEAEAKITAQSVEARQATRWHLIGHLQSNKARRAVQLFDLIHTIDSLKLAQTLDRLVAELNRPPLDVLVQINVSGEASKEGFALKNGIQSNDWSNFVATIRQMQDLPHLNLQGMMTIPPFDQDLDQVVRPCFRMAREVRDALQADLNRPLPQLSMGMSGDFEVAIEEGATLVRVGTAIFGHR